MTLYAFNLAGVRSTALLQEHMESARMAANLLQGLWGSQGVNLWTVDLQQIALIAGQATYAVPSNTIAMLDAYITQNASGAAINRYIIPISRTEYASYPNPQQQGFPTTYWFDRLLSPTVTLWPVPDGSESLFSFYRTRQIQDASFSNGASLEVAFYALEAMANALAYRLALIWNPEKAPILKMEAQESWDIFVNQNVETSSVYISPQVQGYFTA